MLHRVSNTEDSQLLQKMIIEDAQRELLLEGHDPTETINSEIHRQTQYALPKNQTEAFVAAKRALEILAIGRNGTFPQPTNNEDAAIIRFTQRLNRIWFNVSGGENTPQSAIWHYAVFEKCGTKHDFKVEANALKTVLTDGVRGIRDTDVRIACAKFCEVIDGWVEQSNNRAKQLDMELIKDLKRDFEIWRSALHGAMSKPNVK